MAAVSIVAIVLAAVSFAQGPAQVNIVTGSGATGGATGGAGIASLVVVALVQEALNCVRKKIKLSRLKSNM